MGLKGTGTGIIILAAGALSRTAAPRQRLRSGRASTRTYAEAALASLCDPVLVVTGADAERVRGELSGLPVWVVENPDWQEGIGASIRTGITAVEKTEVEAALLVSCDQPLIPAPDLARMAAVAGAHPGSIVASHSESIGIPALFPREWFAQLRMLRGGQGPRHLIMSNASLVRRVAIDPVVDAVERPRGGSTPTEEKPRSR